MSCTTLLQFLCKRATKGLDVLYQQHYSLPSFFRARKTKTYPSSGVSRHPHHWSSKLKFRLWKELHVHRWGLLYGAKFFLKMTFRALVLRQPSHVVNSVDKTKPSDYVIVCVRVPPSRVPPPLSFFVFVFDLDSSKALTN